MVVGVRSTIAVFAKPGWSNVSQVETILGHGIARSDRGNGFEWQWQLRFVNATLIFFWLVVPNLVPNHYVERCHLIAEDESMQKSLELKKNHNKEIRISRKRIYQKEK